MYEVILIDFNIGWIENVTAASFPYAGRIISANGMSLKIANALWDSVDLERVVDIRLLCCRFATIAVLKVVCKNFVVLRNVIRFELWTVWNSC